MSSNLRTPNPVRRSIFLRSALLIAFLVFSYFPALAGFLYALNDDISGSRIYGFRVNETTGALTALPGFPVTPGSGGNSSIVSERMAVDELNYRIYVINDGADTVSAYNIDPSTGALTPMAFSPISLGSGTWNTIAVHPSGSPVVVTNGQTGGGAMSYSITPTTAELVLGSPFLIGPISAFSSTFSQDGHYFYTGGNTGSAIAGFSVNARTGALIALPGSPFPAGFPNPLAYAMDSSGRLYAMSSTDEILAFTSSGGILSPVNGNPFPPSGMTQRRYGLIHPNQNFYVIAGNSGNNVGVFRITGAGAHTTLSPVPGSPFATGGTTANALAINEDGTYLYVANRLSRNISSFAFDPVSGVLSGRVVQASNSLGTIGAINGIGYIRSARVPAVPADFDGDGRTDRSVYRDGTWWIDSTARGLLGYQWGFPTDRPAPADYDGDGKTDIAVWRPSAASELFILRSADSTVRIEHFGQAGDLLTVGDWDGDSIHDPSVYRGGAAAGDQSYFYFRGSMNNPAGSITFLPWGISGDLPLVGDFDGDGRRDTAIFRPSSRFTYIRNSSNGQMRVAQLGLATDNLVPADYDGDSVTDLAAFRTSDRTWYILESSSGQVRIIRFGAVADIPVPGDYDGDGKIDIAIFRSGEGSWYNMNSGSGTFSFVEFGTNGDIPIPSAYYP